jgi:hypothetical protein
MAYSSRPWAPSSVEKSNSSPASVKEFGLELILPGTISTTNFVPAAVPSLRQTS